MNKKIFSSILFIICLNTNILYSRSFVTLPFEYFNKKTNNSNPIETTPKDYFESFINNSVYTTIKIKDKEIKFHLTTERHTIYMSEKTFNNDIKENSNYNKDIFSLEYIGIPEAQLTKGQFPLLFNNSKNILVDNISYFIAKKKSNTSLSSYASENDEIGFNIFKGNPYERVVIGDDSETEDFYDDIFDFDDEETE